MIVKDIEIDRGDIMMMRSIKVEGIIDRLKGEIMWGMNRRSIISMDNNQIRIYIKEDRRGRILVIMLPIDVIKDSIVKIMNQGKKNVHAHDLEIRINIMGNK